MQIENKHTGFKEKVYKENYEALDNLYVAIINVESDGKDLELAMKQIKIIGIEKTDNQNLSRYQLSIKYLRICSFIGGIIAECADEEEKTKQIVNYYLNDFNMHELNLLGLSWYYDIKFYKELRTVYSAGKIPSFNWNEWLRGRKIEDNIIKGNILQNIMKACKEHINRGGKVKLMSFSKCFGIDLYKFMYLDNDKKSYLNIVKKTQTNILKVKDKRMPVYKYNCQELSEGSDFDFFFDFSEVRSEKNIFNLNSWFKKFLEEEFISQKELNSLKNNLTFDNNVYKEWLAYYLLKEKRKEEGKSGISSRINPIKDREVIASNVLWDTINYNDSIQKENVKSDVMYRFELNEDDFMELIYEYYYQLYVNLCAEKERNAPHDRENYLLKFDHSIKEEQELILKLREKIKLEIEELKSNQENKLEDEDIEINIGKKISLENLLVEYSNFIENIVNLKEKSQFQSSDKVNVILSMIDWEYEIINKNLIQELNFQNIYQWDLNSDLNINNLFINLFKELCKKICFSEV